MMHSMCEGKYDLLLHPTKTDKKIYEQPWYKERLRTKYVKSLGPRDTSKFFHGTRWTFIKDGLDDFRDGLPPPSEGDIVIKPDKSVGPNIQNSKESLFMLNQEGIIDRFTKDQICYSRVSPMKQQRRDHIQEIEDGLKQHPLALYPHLEECMPPEVFEDVVDILDPEMNLVSDDESYDEEEENDLYELELLGTLVQQKMNTAPDTDKDKQNDEPKEKNPYNSILPKIVREEAVKKDYLKKSNDKHTSSPAQDKHIRGVTKDFCSWVSSLGGETNNIEESTIMSQFASGYETKPALSVPIHVVELTNVPPELHRFSSMPSQGSKQDASKRLPTTCKEKKDWTFSGHYEPSWVKFQYGAWYLNPKTWSKRKDGEQLKDPQEVRNQEMSDAKKKSNNMDSELAPKHGAKSFMDFIDNKKTRRPEFLNRVREIQMEQAMLERARLEAENQAKKKAEGRHNASRSASVH